MSTPVSTSKLNPSAVEFVPSFIKNKPYQYTPYYQNDVDPFEMEARCEAVVEILQDDRVRDQLNPAAQQPDSNANATEDNQQQRQQQHHQQQQLHQQVDDDEDIMEMMAMQEECRLEMMKFYIQSQNPNLFEEIYHDVSYPDKPLEPKPKSEREAKVDKAKEQIANDLNPSSSDYVPKKMSELNINK